MWRENADLGRVSDVARECRFRSGRRCGENADLGAAGDVARKNADLGAANDVAKVHVTPNVIGLNPPK